MSDRPPRAAAYQADDRPVRAAAYQRISHVAEMGDEHGVNNQRADQEHAARARGYTIVMSEADNDLSAFTGKRRPGYERVMAAVQRGEVDVILVFQLSRFWRNRVERAKGIEILKEHRISVIATRGPSLDMSTAYGRAMAGLLGEFDTMESEVKSERQSTANEHAARAGLPRLATHRPFGWKDDRLTLELAEASAIADGCAAILRGGTITGVLRDWEARGLRPVQSRSGQWKRNSIRGILTSPRIAGISAYKDIELGPGQWQPVVSEETLRAVQWTLARRSRPGRGATSLLGGLALCRCGNPVVATVTRRGKPGYRCRRETRDGRPGPHVDMKREPVDAYVAAAVFAWLALPGVAARVLAPPGEDSAALIAEEAVIQARLAALGSMFMDGAIGETDLASGRARGEERLAEIRGRLAQLGRQSALTPLVLAGAPAAGWETLDMPRRRAVIADLMTVTLYPPGQGARRFDPDVVLPEGRGITWKL